MTSTTCLHIMYVQIEITNFHSAKNIVRHSVVQHPTKVGHRQGYFSSVVVKNRIAPKHCPGTILDKLSHYGIRRKAIEILTTTSYLTNRFQYVSIEVLIINNPQHYCLSHQVFHKGPFLGHSSFYYI